jgi:hypothetical protein
VTAVVFLSGRAMNDALAAAGRAHRRLFEQLGHEYIEINFAQSGADDLLNRAIRGQAIELVYSAVGMGADIRGTTADGRDVNLWEASRIPFISLSGDSPAYFFDRHVMPTAWHAGLYVYPEHLNLRRRLKPTTGIYGAIPPFPMDMTDKRDIDFRKKESGKLLFLKNGNDPEKLVQTWRVAMPPASFIALTELAGELALGVATEKGCDIDALVTAYFHARGWEIADLLNLRLFFVAQLDDYLRRIKSTMIAEVLAEFPVEIHGFNWEHFDFEGKQATFVPGGDYTQSRDRIIASLGLVDMSPNTELAPHDRPMRAFGLCTLCLTNQQRFFSDHFENSEAFSYRFEKDHLRQKIADTLAHPKRSVELGLAVAEQFRRDHRPGDFAQYMIDTASHIRLASGPRHPGLQDFFVWPPTKP